MTIPLTLATESSLNIASSNSATPASSSGFLSPSASSLTTSSTSSTTILPCKRPFGSGSASASSLDMVITDSLTEPQSAASVSPNNENHTHLHSQSQSHASQPRPDHRMSRVMSGTELSPLKLLGGGDVRSPSACSTGSTGSGSGDNNFRTSISSNHPISPSEKTVRSPRKFPEKRFPVRVTSPSSQTRTRAGSEATTAHSMSPDRPTLSIGEALLDNGNLAKAIQIFEDEDKAMTTPPATLNSATGGVANGFNNDHDAIMEDDESTVANDNDVSNYSNFSAIRLGQSPDIQDQAAARARGSSPMHHPTSSGGNTTNLLMDFTDNLRHPHGSLNKTPSRRPVSMMPSTSSDYSQASNAYPPTATPGRQGGNLLDFDIPPMPTPRSIPSVTPRELESLKSQFLSEISSLKASLLGKEAEVQSLKAAVGDAEKRVGESMEQMREERTMRETLAVEKEGWEHRGRELETVLRKLREDYATTHREREEFESKLNESEGRREMAEMMAQEAESKMAGMRAGQQQLQAAAAQATAPGAPKGIASRSPAAATAREVEVAVERVARELHTLYKGKHETKVAALKKSYEVRWEKKVADLETKVMELEQENDRLRGSHHDQTPKVDPAQVQAEEERRAQAAHDQATLRQLEAEVDKLEAVLREVSRDNGDLRQMLEQERVEKGELVQLAEEMMAMQASMPAVQQQQQQQQHGHQDRHEQVSRTPARPAARSPARSSTGNIMAPRPPSAASASSTGSGGNGPSSSNLRTPAKPRPMSMIATSSMSRPSGLRAPGIAGRGGVVERGKPGGAIMPRPGATRSSMMPAMPGQRRVG
ncbi:chromosome segregation protein [Ceratocystis lukuohia]|uniref:Chromosome segregation protein n=1 Tax=Ceratocystis lukuohia TaxID=2019550 RepID=A0ABR4MAS0_9PEZI